MINQNFFIMKTKVCKKCGRELPLSEFYKGKTYKDGHKNECKECFNQQRKQYKKQYYLDNKETILEHQKQYRQEHKEEIAEYFKQYRQEHKVEIAERRKQYFKQYYLDNKDVIAEQQKQYHQTPFGRAKILISSYRREDKKYNRGECTLTPQWIVDNIFTSKCHWCKETDWTKLGCDRIDNSLPHTPDNVNPCCEECNKKRGRKDFEEFRNCMQNSI